MIQKCPKCQKPNQLYKEGFTCSYCGYKKITERDRNGNVKETDLEKTRLKRRVSELEKQIVALKKENETLKNAKKGG